MEVMVDIIQQRWEGRLQTPTRDWMIPDHGREAEDGALIAPRPVNPTGLPKIITKLLETKYL